MIALWNRREIYNGFSIQEFNRLKDILIANGIDYTFKTVNRSASSNFDVSRASIGTLGENLNLSYEYHLYVHKNDYEDALFKINN